MKHIYSKQSPPMEANIYGYLNINKLFYGLK